MSIHPLRDLNPLVTIHFSPSDSHGQLGDVEPLPIQSRKRLLNRAGESSV
jgi:hypothetical protein